tara:strand:- start:42 stop:596 length:555 start_codon:yes stop_codon:yes gene_type:complete
MPFIADSRCGVWNIELNVGEICGELERLLDKEYSDNLIEGSKFWLYVSQIEYALNRCDTMPDFWEWFLTDGEYNNVEMWNEIEDLFVEEDEAEDPNYSDKICAERKANGTHNYLNGNNGCWCLDYVDVKECGHRFECGCGKPTCMEMDGQECDDIGLCSNEGCKHYYDSRNDNCDCNDKDCPYC